MTAGSSHVKKRQQPGTIETVMLSYPVTPSLHREGEMLGRSSNVLKSFIHFFFYCWLDKLSALHLEEKGAGQMQLSSVVFWHPTFFSPGGDSFTPEKL